MIEGIDPIRAEMRLDQLLGEDAMFAQVPAGAMTAPAAAVTPAAQASIQSAPLNLGGNAFEDILSKAVESLNGVSRTENYANLMVEKYARGEAELMDVMVAQSKMSIAAQLAVTTVNSAVNTLKEITQMQI